MSQLSSDHRRGEAIATDSGLDRPCSADARESLARALDDACLLPPFFPVETAPELVKKYEELIKSVLAFPNGEDPKVVSWVTVESPDLIPDALVNPSAQKAVTPELGKARIQWLRNKAFAYQVRSQILEPMLAMLAAARTSPEPMTEADAAMGLAAVRELTRLASMVTWTGPTPEAVAQELAAAGEGEADRHVRALLDILAGSAGGVGLNPRRRDTVLAAGRDLVSEMRGRLAAQSCELPLGDRGGEVLRQGVELIDRFAPPSMADSAGGASCKTGSDDHVDEVGDQAGEGSTLHFRAADLDRAKQTKKGKLRGYVNSPDRPFSKGGIPISWLRLLEELKKGNAISTQGENDKREQEVKRLRARMVAEGWGFTLSKVEGAWVSSGSFKIAYFTDSESAAVDRAEELRRLDRFE